VTDIWLVRHGEAAASWDQSPDPGLSPLGHQQARAAAEQLHSRVPGDAALLTSPKARARETGVPFSMLREQDLIESAAFIEVQAPVPLSERKQWLRQFMSQRWSEQPDALWEWRKAITDALQEFREPTVIFTHFLVINAVLAECWQKDSVLLSWPANGSIHHFRVHPERIESVALGEQMESVVT
jgi:broad specificity phosphatase PhoE